MQCCGNGIGAHAKLFSQVALADDYIASWVALMDIAPVARYLIGERPKFSLLLTLRTLGSGFVGFETPSARSCNSDMQSPRWSNSSLEQSGRLSVGKNRVPYPMCSTKITKVP